MIAAIATPNDVSALSIPTQVSVPESIDAVAIVLDGVGGLLSAGHWATAAVVWAFTEPGTGGPRTVSKVTQLSLREFAELKIRGLSSINSVRKYRKAWQVAIDAGWAKDAGPGMLCDLPDQPLETPNGVHVSRNTGENEWYTPIKYVKAARAVMGTIDLDPASCEAANATINATTFFSIDDDGLSRDWAGRVWMNPPYAQPLVRHFCERLARFYAAGSVTQAIVLLNNATETVWFGALATVSSAICFPQGRIEFWQPKNAETGGPLQGQAFVYLGHQREKFRDVFSNFGLVLQHTVERGD